MYIPTDLIFYAASNDTITATPPNSSIMIPSNTTIVQSSSSTKTITSVDVATNTHNFSLNIHATSTEGKDINTPTNEATVPSAPTKETPGTSTTEDESTSNGIYFSFQI